MSAIERMLARGDWTREAEDVWREVEARLSRLERAVTPEAVEEIDEERVRVAARRHGFAGGDSQALADWIERRLEVARRVDEGESDATVRLTNGELALAQVRLQNAMRTAVGRLFNMRDDVHRASEAATPTRIENIALDLQKAIMEQHT